MTEAWEVKDKKFGALRYFFLRRYELTKYVLRKKSFHRDHQRLARLRAWLLVLKGHETEICCFCGRAVEVVWWCEDKNIWGQVTGWTNGGGVSCLKCFDRLFDKKAKGCGFLTWTCKVESKMEPEALSRILSSSKPPRKFVPFQIWFLVFWILFSILIFVIVQILR